MASSVAGPLERQLSQISGVTSISSSSSLGETQIQVDFDLNRNVDGAAQDVQTAINAAGGQLPKSMPNPPTYEKVNPADANLMSIAVTSTDLPISVVDDYAENYLTPQIARITGVGAIDYHGQQKPSVRIQINPTIASAMGLSLEDIRSAIATATVDAPKGTLDGPKQSLTLDTTDQLFDATAFSNVIIAYRAGAHSRRRSVGQRGRGHPAGRLGHGPARGTYRCPQAARLQHQRDRSAHQGYLAEAAGLASALSQAENSGRANPDHPRLGRRRSIHHGGEHRP